MEVPFGYGFVSTSEEPVACGAGYYWQNHACVQCTAGNFCPYNNGVGDAAIACPTGFYTDYDGASECMICPPGYECTSTAASPCSDGQYSLGGTATSSCTDCPAGYECVTPQSVPTKCPIGTWSDDGQSACTECDAGKECPFLAGTSATND